ncbi:MAG: phosphate propanoyltransferase [Oscillospiraceae bacterium]|jgi:putative phosphotransacetylase|nr:phosphate propanoyltransferase [Oscillospiraceae bacterium]
MPDYPASGGGRSVLIEGSARHVHLKREDLDALFGSGYTLRKKRDLLQPGEFLTEEKVTLTGPRGSVERVSVLGPLRSATQAEISITDARALGVSAPVRLSGDIAGSAPIRLTGPAGSVELAEGCIVAKRHLHVTPADAETLGITGRNTVRVKVGGERAVTFDEVTVRVSENFYTEVHLDYDEMNAAGLSGEVYGEIL